jgi:hypothetical protein
MSIRVRLDRLLALATVEDGADTRALVGDPIPADLVECHACRLEWSSMLRQAVRSRRRVGARAR